MAQPCIHFLKGYCQYGADCRNPHIRSTCDYSVHCPGSDCVLQHPAGSINQDEDIQPSELQLEKRAKRFKERAQLKERKEVKKAKKREASPVKKAKLSDGPLVGKSSTPIVDFVRAGAGSQLKPDDVRSKETLQRAFQEIRRSRPADKVSEWWITALPKLRMVRQDLVVQQIDHEDFGRQVGRFLVEQALLVDDKKTALTGLSDAVTAERAFVLWWAGGRFRDLSPLSEPIATAVMGGNLVAAKKLLMEFTKSKDSLHRAIGRVLGKIIDAKFQKILEACTHGSLPKLP